MASFVPPISARPAERKQRYTEAEKRGMGAEGIEGGRYRGATKYGHRTYAEMGYRPEKEAGMAFLSKKAQQAKHGAFAPMSWQQQWDPVTGALTGVKPMANQSGRIYDIKQMGLDPTQWLDPSKVLKPGQWKAIQRTTTGAKGQERNAFFEANPDLANIPGGGMDVWEHQRWLNNLPTDPATGWKISKSGELWDPGNALLKKYRGEAPGVAPSRVGAGAGITPGAPAPPGLTDANIQDLWDRIAGNAQYAQGPSNQYSGWAPLLNMGLF